MTSTSDQKPEFLFANCEQCEGIIRIPITVRPDSSVSCPHCDTHFQLARVLAQQVPEVQIIDGPTAPEFRTAVSEVEIDTGDDAKAITQLDGKFIVPSQLAKGVKKRRRRRSSSERSPSIRNHTGQLSEAEESRLARRAERAKREREKLQQQREASANRSVGSPTEVARSQSSKSSSRRQSSKRSPIVEAIKICVGGMMAIPIAYLLLMWIFSRDPFSLASTINAVAPSLVPNSMILEDDEDTQPSPSFDPANDSDVDSLSVPASYSDDDVDPESN